MQAKTICFLDRPTAKAVPVYVTRNAGEHGAVPVYELKSAVNADILAYRVKDRHAAQMVVWPLLPGARGTWGDMPD